MGKKSAYFEIEIGKFDHRTTEMDTHIGIPKERKGAQARLHGSHGFG
jgi:hypothetical protein